MPIREAKGGVSIRRLRYMQLSRRSRLGRLINYFSFTLSVLLHLFEIRNYRAVIVYSNPPVLPIAAILANKLFKTKIIFVSYDVYPDKTTPRLIQFHILKNAVNPPFLGGFLFSAQ